MTPLSICLVSTYYPPASEKEDGLHASALANALSAAGHAVTVIDNPAAIDGTAPHAARTPNADRPGIRRHPVPSRAGALGLLALHQSGRPLGIARALDAALEGRFDVLHFHNVSLIGGPAVLAFGRGREERGTATNRAGRTLRLLSLNDHWLVCPTHLLWRWTDEVCSAPACTRCCLAQGKPPQPWRRGDLLERSMSAIDAVIAPSRLTAEAHHARGFRHPMVHLPGLHARPPDASPADASTSDEPHAPAGTSAPPYFLLESRLEPHKGIDAFLDDFARQPVRHRLLIVGDGRDEARLRQRSKSLPGVHWPDVRSSAERDRLRRRAIASIAPARALQTFCHVTAASFAAGTPVVAATGGAAAEIVAEHGGGLLYADAGELAGALDRLADDTALRARLARAAKRTHDLEFAPATYVRRYVALVEALRERAARDAPLGAADTTVAGLDVLG